ELIRLFRNQALPANPLVLRLFALMVGSLPCVAMWTLALLSIRLNRPGADLRRLALRPGMAACLMVILGMGVACVLNLLDMTIPGSWQGAPMILIWLIPLTLYLSAPPVAAAWSLLALTGRWNPEPTWTDRLGRVLGAWLVVVVLATSGGFLFRVT